MRTKVGRMPRTYAWLSILALVACGSHAQRADPASDAPEGTRPALAQRVEVGSYTQAVREWRTPEDINAWIGARFRYDTARAIALSETQRGLSGPIEIHAPEALFEAPSGVCVDLARFAVETLRQVDPSARPRYLVIEFAPVSIAGNTLRLHWVATFRRDGGLYVFADSKRPGHVAGPYASLQAFAAEYAGYRGREIVAYRELDSYQRARRTQAAKQERQARP